MKHPAGPARRRRLVESPPKVRLNLKRSPRPEPDDEMGVEQKSHFWKWVGLVALFHVLIIGLIGFIYENAEPAKPADQFISLLPEGDVVKGTAGEQKAHKIGTSTPAPAEHHASVPPPPAHLTPQVPPKTITPKSVVKNITTQNSLADQPVAPPKPVPPKPKPKVKVDLSKLVDAPQTEKPVTKPPIKKTVAQANDSPDNDLKTASKADSMGLSKEEIAAKLGEKLDAAGVKSALKTGASGSLNAHPNSFADFYASIRDQVMSQWESPNLSDETAVNPVVQIHVEKDGRVPAESVRLVQSSGNSSYDDSAVSAAKNLGYLHEPLPDGCPPDIPITFKLTR